MASPFDIIPGGAVAPPASPASPDFMSQILSMFGGGGQNQNQQNPAIPPVAPIGGVGGVTSPPGAVGLGPNVGTLQGAVGGVSALGNLWTAWNATNLAKQSFNFNKQLSTDNYTNQADTLNTELSDRANARGVMENQTPAQTQSYIAANRLKTTI